MGVLGDLAVGVFSPSLTRAHSPGGQCALSDGVITSPRSDDVSEPIARDRLDPLHVPPTLFILRDTLLTSSSAPTAEMLP